VTTTARQVVDMAVVDGGRFLVLADDDGGLTCINRTSYAVLWTRRVHESGVCAVGAVGERPDEQVLSVDRRGMCVLTDPSQGIPVRRFPLPGCPTAFPHRHLLEVAWDRQHVVASCLQPHPPAIVAMVDAAATQGLVVNVHDRGGMVVLMDRDGVEFARSEDVRRPLAAGATTRVAYLRAPEHWVGVRDLATGHEVSTCRHCYERGGYAVAVSRDERWVAWSGYDKYLYREEIREFVRVVCVDPPEDYGWDVLRGGAEFVDLRFSPDGELLLAGDSDGGVTVVPLGDGGGAPRLLGAVDQHVAALAFADPDTVVAVGTAGEVCSWRLTGTVLPD
jgi:hypothetical protein